MSMTPLTAHCAKCRLTPHHQKSSVLWKSFWPSVPLNLWSVTWRTEWVTNVCKGLSCYSQLKISSWNNDENDNISTLRWISMARMSAGLRAMTGCTMRKGGTSSWWRTPPREPWLMSTSGAGRPLFNENLKCFFKRPKCPLVAKDCSSLVDVIISSTILRSVTDSKTVACYF